MNRIYEVTAIRSATYEVVADSRDEAVHKILNGKGVLVDETTLKMTAEVKDEDQNE